MIDPLPIIPRKEEDLIEKVKVLNIKKGDVLLLRYNDNFNIPREAHKKMIEKSIEIVKKCFLDEGVRVSILAFPKSLDVEVIRLEEWFV